MMQRPVTKLLCQPQSLMLVVMLTLSGCAYIPHDKVVNGPTSAQPAPPTTAAPNGSIFQAVQPMNYGYQLMFEDRRSRNVGDILTIVLQ